MPQFRLGDTVEYVSPHPGARLTFTVIGIDTRGEEIGDCTEVLLGSMSGNPIAGVRFQPVQTIAILTTDRLGEDFLGYLYGRWEDVKYLERCPSKNFSRVSRRRLQKRMRDQMAQEIYKESACRK